MNVVVRVDASPAIGTGHLMRCLTLADALKEKGDKISFLCAFSTEPWRNVVESRGHNFTTLPLDSQQRAVPDQASAHAHWAPWGYRADAIAVVAALPKMVDWLIVDHYALDERWESLIRSKARYILAIDDIADRRHNCDLLLDHNPQDSRYERYRGLVPPSAQCLIGPWYALLNPAFAEARKHRKHQREAPRRLIVLLSGTDPTGVTLDVIEALSLPDVQSLNVDVVIGSASPYLQEIKTASTRINARLHIDSTSVAELFSQADLAIGAGGVAALERCCVGLPTIAITIAANQESSVTELARRGAVLSLGRYDQINKKMIHDELLGLLESPERLQSMSTAAWNVTDGLGATRVISCLSEAAESR